MGLVSFNTLLKFVSIFKFIAHNDHEGIKEEKHDDVVNLEVPVVAELEPTRQVQQKTWPLLTEPILRRTIRKRNTFTKYPLCEYVLLIEGEELKTYQEPISYDKQKECYKAIK